MLSFDLHPSIVPGLQSSPLPSLPVTMVATTTTLWRLPPQELPSADLRDAVFVTIWLFSFLAFTATLHLIQRKRGRTWSEFADIKFGTLLLAL